MKSNRNGRLGSKRFSQNNDDEKQIFKAGRQAYKKGMYHAF